MTERDGRVWTMILRHALHTRPASVEALAGATGFPAEDVEAALAALHDAGAIYLRGGAVAAAYPFSLVPTPHRVIIGGITAYANCAIDALAVPPMADETAHLSSTCGHCGVPVTLIMRADRILASQPAAPVVFYPDKDCCAAGPAVLTRCPHIQFFCHRDHAARWQHAYPELRGTVLDLAGAAAYASRHFAEAIRAVLGEAQDSGVGRSRYAD
ncbi:MAG TPA: organomercurial lyase [bacterium]|nr:organomercurial lyase [bacterium]